MSSQYATGYYNPGYYAPPPAAVQPQVQKESFTKKYLSWLTPGLALYLILAFFICVAAVLTVGLEFSSVPHACAQWSFDCTNQG
uniref:Uncharacterized protein n=1 Tax=viral metagenome TaxID=1070528 RepID=A0A6C0BDX1_9ZZZZ